MALILCLFVFHHLAGRPLKWTLNVSRTQSLGPEARGAAWQESEGGLTSTCPGPESSSWGTSSSRRWCLPPPSSAPGSATEGQEEKGGRWGREREEARPGGVHQGCCCCCWKGDQKTTRAFLWGGTEKQKPVALREKWSNQSSIFCTVHKGLRAL